MNKDFLTKPISLKDIKIPKINLKDIKNKKIIAICIFIIVFLIGILVVGFRLLDLREEAKSKQTVAETKFNSLQSIPSKEVMENEIITMKEEIIKYDGILEPVKPREFSEILSDFAKNAPIKWDKENAKDDLTEVRGFENYSIYKVNIKPFTGSLEDIEKFLTYVKEYEKVVRIDSLSFNKNEITGKLTGQVSLSFYFDKLDE